MIRIFTLCIMSSILLLGCQKPTQSTTEHEQTQQQNVKKTTHQDKCKNLDQAMQKVNENTTVEALNNINAQLKQCMNKVKNPQQLKWLNASTKMYQRFLKSDTDEQSATAFGDYMYSILENKDNHRTSSIQKGDPVLFKKLGKRDQYLLNHQGQAYIDFQHQGEGIFDYRREPQYGLDIFASTLPKDQQVFITRMAKDNQEVLIGDAALTISWAELVDRALFWENYIKQYPKGYFTADAKELFAEYTDYIFFGLDNTPVSDEYKTGTWFDEDALKEIKALAKRKDTQLSGRAQKFLMFIETPVEQRQQKFSLAPIKTQNEAGDELTSSGIARQQLREVLDLPAYGWQINSPQDCHSDAICIVLEYD